MCILDQMDRSKRHWCPTKVDHLGFYIVGEGNWGYCGNQCFVENKTHQLQSNTRGRAIQKRKPKSFRFRQHLDTTDRNDEMKQHKKELATIGGKNNKYKKIKHKY